MRRPAAWLVLLAAACVSSDAPDLEDLEAQAASCEAAPRLPLRGAEAVTVALNAYYLQEEAARALRRGEPSSEVVEEVFAKARALGVEVVRTHAFNDDPAKAGDSAIQVAPLAYDEVGLRGLDLVLARAAVHGVRLVLPLGNFWDDYGGARQYVAWSGLPGARTGDPRFFTDAAVVGHYREHLRRLLDRRNAFDGLRTGDHPAVLAWEILNEPRGFGLDHGGEQMRAWVDDVARHVKALAPGALVGTGEEGLEAGYEGYDAPLWERDGTSWMFGGGSSFRRNVASPWVDYASVHLFPESWGVASDLVPTAGALWIAEHARVARAAGKPLLVGEMGLPNDGAFDLDERRAIYRGWFRCSERAGAAATAPWLFANDARPDGWDRHSFYYRDGTDPADPANRYADLVRDAAAR